jgi:hypothetical protein
MGLQMNAIIWLRFRRPTLRSRALRLREPWGSFAGLTIHAGERACTGRGHGSLQSCLD